MTTYEGVVRAVELDNVVVELSDALKWVRKQHGMTVSDPQLENKIARRLAIGCIKQVHLDMHRGGLHFFEHRQMEECRLELLRRCEELRYTEVFQLMRMAMGTNFYTNAPHTQYLELDL